MNNKKVMNSETPSFNNRPTLGNKNTWNWTMRIMKEKIEKEKANSINTKNFDKR